MRHGVRHFLAKMCCVSVETQEEVTEDTVETGVELYVEGGPEDCLPGREEAEGKWVVV